MIASVVCVALARSIWPTSNDKHVNSKYDQSQRHERVEVNVETVCPFQPILNLVAQKQLVAHNPVFAKGQRKNEKGSHTHARSRVVQLSTVSTVQCTGQS